MEPVRFTARIPQELLDKLDDYRESTRIKMSRNTALNLALQCFLQGWTFPPAKRNVMQQNDCVK